MPCCSPRWGGSLPAARCWQSLIASLRWLTLRTGSSWWTSVDVWRSLRRRQSYSVIPLHCCRYSLTAALTASPDKVFDHVLNVNVFVPFTFRCQFNIWRLLKLWTSPSASLTFCCVMFCYHRGRRHHCNLLSLVVFLIAGSLLMIWCLLNVVLCTLSYDCYAVASLRVVAWPSIRVSWPQLSNSTESHKKITFERSEDTRPNKA